MGVPRRVFERQLQQPEDPRRADAEGVFTSTRMAASSEAEPALSREEQLWTFCTSEISGFFGYLSTAVAGFGAGSDLPTGKFRAAAKAVKKESAKSRSALHEGLCAIGCVQDAL